MALPSGLPIPAAERSEVVGISAAGTAGGAAQRGAPPGALQLLKKREIAARPRALGRSAGRPGRAGGRGLGGMAERRWRNSENDFPPMAATKKPRRWQGRVGNQGWNSGLGRCDPRCGDAPTQAAAPAEGRTSAEQGQGARNHCGGCGRRSNEHIDGFGGAVDGPGARQAWSCEAKVSKAFVVEGCAA
jgi:hypothetical protein